MLSQQSIENSLTNFGLVCKRLAPKVYVTHARQNLKKNSSRSLPRIPAKVKHLTDLVNETLCPKKDGKEYHQSDCLLRNCQNCGVSVFKVLDKEEDLTNDAPLIKWHKFEYVVTGVNEGNSDKKKLYSR